MEACSLNTCYVNGEARIGPLKCLGINLYLGSDMSTYKTTLIMVNILDHIVDLISNQQHGAHMCHDLSRHEEGRKNLAEYLVGKCIILQDSHIGSQYTPTNILNKYDMEAIESTKDFILEFLQTFRNTILCQLQRLSLMYVVRSSRWHLDLQNRIHYGK